MIGIDGLAVLFIMGAFVLGCYEAHRARQKGLKMRAEIAAGNVFHGKAPYRCTVCGKVFNHQVPALEHLEAAHSATFTAEQKASAAGHDAA